MAGMFPQAGTEAQNTLNADTDVQTVAGCTPLFHRANCVPRFDPVAANAMLSEILEAINLVQPYDCTRLDNLAQALQDLTSLCGLPVIPAPILNDSIAGCFGGVDGRVSLSAIRGLLGTCGLPVSNSPDADDTIAMCVDGVNAQVPVSALAAIVAPPAPAVPGWLAVGSHVFADLFDASGPGASIGVPIGTTWALGGTVGFRNSNGAGIGVLFTNTGTWRNLGGFEVFSGAPDGTTRLWLRVA